VVTRKRKIPIIFSQDERDEEEDEFQRIRALNVVQEKPSQPSSSSSSPQSLSQQIYSSPSSNSESHSIKPLLSQSPIQKDINLNEDEVIKNINNNLTKSYDPIGRFWRYRTSDDNNSNTNVQIPAANSLIKTKRSVD